MNAAVGVGRRTAHAAAWGFAATAAGKVVTLAALALLARVLAPREFGLLAFAMAYITYAETIGDLGSGMALVYWPNRREDAAQITFLINVVAGLVWCGATLLLAPYVAEFFKTPAGTPIVRVLALSFPIKFLGTAHDALAQKDLRFRARAIPEFGFAGVKAGVAIVLAYMGYGAWSLVYGHLAGLACSTIFLWVIVPWRPSLTLPLDLLRPMLSYGRNITVVNVLHAVVSDADLAFVGHYLGVTTLGFYQMAARIPETGVSVVLRVISKVLFPAFAQLHAAGERLRRPFLLATRAVPAVTFPAAIGLAVLARPIMLAAFGPQWGVAGPILALLSLYVGISTLANHAGDVMKATGHAPLLAKIGVIKAVLVLTALYFAAQKSAVAVAGSLVIVSTVTTAINIVISSRLIEVSLTDVLKAFVPSVASVGVMAIGVMLWMRFVVASLGVWPQLLSSCAVGAVVYLVTLRFADPELFRWSKKILFARTNAPVDKVADVPR